MKSIAALIGKITELDPLAGRKVAAMIGAVVGDAACVSLEWIYSQEKMAHLTKGQDPVFFPTSHSPYYILPNGNISGYGDEAVQTLKAMSDNDGKFDELKLVQHYCNYFGDKESPYQIALTTRGDWKRSTANLPVEGPWIQKAVLHLMENFQSGQFPTGSKDAYEHDALVAMLPLIIQSSPDLDFQVLRKGFHLLTQCPFSVDHHLVEAKLLSQFIKGSENPVSDTKIKLSDSSKLYQEIVTVERCVERGLDPKHLVRQFGMACELPGSFMSSLVSILRAKSYPDGIRETIHCAGALCARSNFIGACLGAKYGIENIPRDWIEKVDGIEDIMENSIKCFSS